MVNLLRYQGKGLKGRTHLCRSGETSAGFTLVEIIVSMVLTLIFLSVTMQIFISAAYLRAKANEYSDAHNWIQEDFEQILTKAKRYEMQAIPYSSHCGAGTLASSFITDDTEGLGGQTTQLGARNLGGQTLRLTRKATNVGTLDESRLLTVNYKITRSGSGETVVDIDTKVTIYAAFNCPSS